MLKDEELGIVLRADHEREEAGVGDSAAVFTTDVEEDGALAIPVLVAQPVALLVSASIQVVEVVNQVGERRLLELVQVDVGKGIEVQKSVAQSGCHGHCCK